MEQDENLQRHESFKKNHSPEFLKSLENAKDPFSALDEIINRASDYSHEDRPAVCCSIIDSMSPIGGAFIFGIAKMKHLHEKDAEQKSLLGNIIKLAELLELEVVKGLLYARDKSFELSGKNGFLF
ncbi:MAG TPA: hypothetical protein PK950_00610 [Candidatus Paceibacterota bacterium]|nr:hypothetical protein [Candidatus Paceibacterota bacterium]